MIFFGVFYGSMVFQNTNSKAQVMFWLRERLKKSVECAQGNSKICECYLFFSEIWSTHWVLRKFKMWCHKIKGPLPFVLVYMLLSTIWNDKSLDCLFLHEGICAFDWLLAQVGLLHWFFADFKGLILLLHVCAQNWRMLEVLVSRLSKPDWFFFLLFFQLQWAMNSPLEISCTLCHRYLWVDGMLSFSWCLSPHHSTFSIDLSMLGVM